jgi:hypothetical protein
MEVKQEQVKSLSDKNKIAEESIESHLASAKKNRWPIIVLALLVLLGTGIYFLWQYLNKPAIGDVHVAEQSQAINKPLLPEKESFQGKYVSFVHYSSYIEKSHKIESDEKNNILESAFFSEQSINAKKIALTVEKLPGGNMENSANYKLRITYPQRYQKSEFYQNGVQGIEFSANNDQANEKVFFVQKENILVTLSISGLLSADENSDSEAKDLVGSLTFSLR